MAFRDNNPKTSFSGDWVSSDEKQEIIDSGIPFILMSLQDDDANKYGPRFVATILLANPETGDEEERLIGFPKGTVESRDRDLLAYQKYLADGEDPETCKLTKAGQSIIVVFPGDEG